MAQSIKARLVTLRQRLEDARTAVYAAAPDSTTPFYACLDMASPKVRDTHAKALQAVDEAEAKAIDQGKAYRGRFGTLTFYR